MSQAAAAASAMGGGAGNNFMTGGALGAAGAAAQAAMQRALQQRNSAASDKAASTAAGARMQSRGGGIGKRMSSIESRLDALEGGGESKDPVASVRPVQDFATGGSFGDASSVPPAPVATGTLNATASPGSLEAMPPPGNPAADMFGSEFMRNASVGAAKMRKNKKL